MASFEISIDSAKAVLFLKNGGRRLAYALVNTLNATAKEIQKAERAHAPQIFQLRKAEFVLRQLAIIQFASVARASYEARISVGRKERLLLGMFEAGGDRPAFKGRRVAVPIPGGPARPSISASVPDAFTFRKLQLRRVGAGGRQNRRKTSTDVTLQARTASTGHVQYKGAHRTFILPWTRRAPEGGVFQRIGPEPGDIRLVYSFRQHVRIPADLRWMLIAMRVASTRAPQILAGEVDEAFRRGGSLTSQFESLATTGMLN